MLKIESIIYQDEEKCVQFSALWSGKNRILVREKSVKSQGILFLTEVGHPQQPVYTPQPLYNTVEGVRNINRVS